jgi:hypothetical protein
MRIPFIPLVICLFMIGLFCLFWFVLDDRDPFLFLILLVAGIALLMITKKNE